MTVDCRPMIVGIVDQKKIIMMIKKYVCVLCSYLGCHGQINMTLKLPVGCGKSMSKWVFHEIIHLNDSLDARFLKKNNSKLLVFNKVLN